MKAYGVYILAAGLLAAIAALGVAAMGRVSGLPNPELGAIRFIWAGAAAVLVALIGFFLWLIKRGR